jgi:hypothetical protein
MPYGMSLSIMTIKMPFLSSLLISLHHESVNGVSYTRTNISIGGSCFMGAFVEVRRFLVTGCF